MFEPQNDLERSLVRASTDPAHRPQFVRDFLAADVHAITGGPPPAEPRSYVAETATKVSLLTVDHQGRTCVAMFSSLPRLQAAIDREVAFITMNARDLLVTTRGADLVLNPGAEYGKVFLADEVRRMLDGTLWRPDEPRVVQQATEVLLGQPARYPTELADALGRLFRGNASVQQAYIAHFYDPSTGEPAHTLVAVEATGDWDRVVAEAGMVAAGIQVPDPPVDFVRLGGGGNDGFAGYFRGVQPFYKRKRFGLF